MAFPPLPFYVLRGHEGEVSSISFAENCNEGENFSPTLISGSSVGEIFIWNLQTYRASQKLVSHSKKPVQWLNFHKNCIVSQGRDGNLNVWKSQDDKWSVARSFKINSSGFRQCSILSSGLISYVAVPGDEQHDVNVLNLETGQVAAKCSLDKEGIHGQCTCMKLISSSFCDLLLLCGYEDGKIVAWDCHNQKEISQKKIHKETVTCLDFDIYQRQQGVSGSVDSELHSWSMTSKGELSIKKTVTATNPGILCVSVRSDGKIVASGGCDHRLRIFSWKSLKPLAVLEYHKDKISSLTFSTGKIGKYSHVLAAGSKDKRISLWSIYN